MKDIVNYIHYSNLLSYTDVLVTLIYIKGHLGPENAFKIGLSTVVKVLDRYSGFF